MPRWSVEPMYMARSLPDGLQPLEDLDVAGGVVVLRGLRGLLGAGPGRCRCPGPAAVGVAVCPGSSAPGSSGLGSGAGAACGSPGSRSRGSWVRLAGGVCWTSAGVSCGRVPVSGSGSGSGIFLGDLEGCLHGLCGPPGLSVELDYMMPFRGLPLSGVISVLLRWPCTLSGGPFPCGPFRGWRSPRFRWT